LIKQSQGGASVQILWPPLKNEEEFVDVKTKFITRLGLFVLQALVIAWIYQDFISKGQAQ
jgi:hypothetical protein